MKEAILVMIGGAVGAVMRYGVGRALPMSGSSGWPWATFACNIAGGFAMGLLVGWLAFRGGAQQDRQLAEQVSTRYAEVRDRCAL